MCPMQYLILTWLDSTHYGRQQLLMISAAIPLSGYQGCSAAIGSCMHWEQGASSHDPRKKTWNFECVQQVCFDTGIAVLEYCPNPGPPNVHDRCLPCCFEHEQVKAVSTLRSSQAVPHPSTNRALCRLTSEVGRDPVHSTWYGRHQTSLISANTSCYAVIAAAVRQLTPAYMSSWGVATTTPE